MPKAILLPNMVEFPSESMKRYARELASALRAAGEERGWKIDEIIAHRVEPMTRLLPGVQGEKAASRLGRFVRYPLQAARAAMASGGDVFHVLDHSHANLTLSLPPAKAVLTCHDIIPLLAARNLIPIPSGRATRYTFPLRVRCMKRCRYVIAISESTKRDLVNHAGLRDDRVIVVYYGVNSSFRPASAAGVNPQEERAALLQKHGIPQDAKVILHVGTATRYKNSPALIHALKTLHETPRFGKNVYLLRVGAAFYEDEDALIDTLGVRERIVHAGKIFDDALLASYYRAADVFAFPSIWEGFGWPPLEAMACGTPVVTSNVASLPEVVADAGVTLDPQDHAGLAEALGGILSNDDLRAALGEKARLRAARFTWEQCGRDTLGVYEKVISAAAKERTSS